VQHALLINGLAAITVQIAIARSWRSAGVPPVAPEPVR
jgi:hypothetical protein